MENGTIKTETWAHFNKVGQEYFRYEVITRWWSPEGGGMAWKHTIIHIDREGDVTDAVQTERNLSRFKELLDSFVTTGDSRSMIAEQHHQLVRRTLG